ncbi:related to ISC1 - Inositol phosphoSphingolipid phospholipase [Melanopsichium pennsylvanicum]|uniref:Related to ISC1 - Inositol phosphoSphingolipid phospholipase n=2 Tax=Melanopsichium pennsylvanicum TaxID=63383 RepID=A0AAJ4XMP5_9BASI|nr:related to ISC1-Inositol phosphoSphingolipid phospholipase [Melanopsichium pennsylvanicum 4]SNX83858.1 related to ISC1 - Inositol phosphoSphingolipid phospholipase [Melanopsichium pennsylvanicum]
MPRLPPAPAPSASEPSHVFSPAAVASMSQTQDDGQLGILTLNVWGLKYISKQRIPRIKAIATHFASPSTPQYDFVCLQEMWYESKDWRFLRHALSSRYPHSKFFYSGAFGSGLAILSRWSIHETKTHPYSLNGQPIHVQNGDWFVGKACGSITIDHPRLGLVDIWNTHFVAAGGEDGPEHRRAHRITQAYELAAEARKSASRQRHVIVVGDLNSTPPSLAMGLLKNVGGLYDSFLDSHPDLGEQTISLDAVQGGGTQGRRPDPERAIEDLGVTCDSPLNTWTAGKKLDERATKAAGKRLDYILYRGPLQDSKGARKGLAFAASVSNRGRLSCKSSKVVMTDIVPGQQCSFSDHFGVESVFDIISHPSEDSTIASVDESARKVVQHRVLTSSLHALAGAFAASRSTQMSHFYVFGFALLLAVGLTVASIFQPLGGVNPVFVLLAVVAGWGGTTMLYSAVVWGEWEKRTLRTFMELIELELNYLGPFSANSANVNSTSANHTHVCEGTLF